MTPAVNGTSTVPEPRSALAFYGLRESPFGPGAEGSWLWLGRTHAAVLAALRTAIRRGERVVLLTGEAGAGKTMLADRVGKMVAGEGFRVGKLLGPPIEPADLVRAAARACRIAEPCDTEAALASRVRELPGGWPAGSRGLLIIEEAQSLEPAALVQLGRVSALLPDGALSILLVGQTELNAILSVDENAALRHRVTARCVVDPLPPDEVVQYVQHRLRIAGATGAIFSAAALGRIASLSRGAPGVINVICGRALLAGHVRHATIIDEEIVEQALSLQASELRPTAAGDAPSSGRARGPARDDRRAPATPERSPARRRAVIRYGAPAIAALAIAAAYGSYAGWLSGSAKGPRNSGSPATSSAPRDTPVGNSDTARVAASQVLPARPEPPEPPAPPSETRAVEGATAAPVDTKPAPVPPRAPSVRRPAPAAEGRERAPKQMPAPRDAGPPARDSGADPGDGTAIIDWLLNEGGRR